MIYKTYIVDKDHKSPYEPIYFEATMWRDIGNGIKFRPAKHWASGVYGAEGRESTNGDRRGCIQSYIDPVNKSVPLIMAPWVVEQRHYKKGKYLISAVLSFPNGLSIQDNYFWEIYQLAGKQLFEDVERFDNEKEMENRITELLSIKR